MSTLASRNRSTDAVCYATQHTGIIETGPSPFAGAPPLAIVGRDGTLGVVVNNLDEPAARASAADHLTAYKGIDLHDRTLVESRFRGAMGRCFESYHVLPGMALAMAASMALRAISRTSDLAVA